MQAHGPPRGILMPLGNDHKIELIAIVLTVYLL